jgi:molybdate transport system permease protein
LARALGEFGATAMVAGNIPGKTQTIPVAIYFAAENNDLATAACYVMIISGLTFGLVFGVNRWSRRKNAWLLKGGSTDAARDAGKTVAGIPAEDRV